MSDSKTASRYIPERSTVTRTIDTAALEAAIVRNCAPTLAGIKPACLFTFPGTFRSHVGAATRRAQLITAIGELRTALARMALAVRILAWRHCGALIYVYRPSDLRAHITQEPCARILARASYDPDNLEGCLDQLARRLATDARTRERLRATAENGPAPSTATAENSTTACPHDPTRCQRDFPHEIGCFLGYPPHDIEGFIEHGGQNYLLCGAWKVYADAERAQATFTAYKRCTHALTRAYQRGCSLDALAAAAA